MIQHTDGEEAIAEYLTQVFEEGGVIIFEISTTGMRI